MNQHIKYTKRFAIAIATAVGFIMANSATTAVGQTILIDFGNNTSFRGTNVVNPDVKGHYWNSIQPGLYYAGLLDISNAATTVNFGFSTPVGTDSYNGPAGPTDSGLNTVTNTDIDAAALGDLGITNACYDFAAGAGGPARFEIQGLDPAKKYNLTFYGSHKFNSDSNTVYTVYSDNTYTTVVGTTNLNVYASGTPWLHNRDKVATITNLSPQANNILYVQFVGSAGGDGYLNAMEISTGTPTPPPPPTGQTVLIDFGSDTSFRGVSVVNPDVKGHYWNSVQPGNYIANMINMTNGATTIDLGPDSPVGTDSYNGPAGPTSVPPTPSEIAATDIDAAALGNLGITNAAMDFITRDNAQCRFQLQGLDLTKKYSLTFYGSHKFNSDSNTVYSVYSNNTYTVLIGQTNLNVFASGTPWLHNRDKTVTISNLTPPADGIFYIGFVGSAGGNGYLNAMQISEDVASSTPIVITSQSYNPTSQQLTLTWTSSVGATYTIESTSNLANAFGTLVTGIASGGSSTTTTVTLTGATGFVRVKKE